LDSSLFDDSIERVNITLPRRVLGRLDALAASRHKSRGAFIAELTVRVPDGHSEEKASSAETCPKTGR